MKFVRKVGGKGNITIPKELRDCLELHEGDIIEFDLIKVVRRQPEPAPVAEPERRSNGGVSA